MTFENGLNVLLKVIRRIHSRWLSIVRLNFLFKTSGADLSELVELGLNHLVKSFMHQVSKVGIHQVHVNEKSIELYLHLIR